MRRLLRLLGDNRDFRLLLGADLISLTGDWILRTGLAYQIYVLTGSTLASAAAMLASLVPQIAIGSIAGVYVDRWDRRRTMVVTNVLLAAVLLPLLAVQHPGQAWIVYAVVAASSCLAPFFGTAEQAVIPTLVPEADLIPANSLNAQVRDIARLTGAALGGVIAGFGGITLVTIVDVLTFALAAALLGAMRRLPRAAAPATTPHVLREWAEGARIALSRPALRVVLVFTLITGVGEAVMGTLMAPFVRDVLHGDARAYGVIMSAQAIGGIAGGVVATLFGHRFSARALLGWGAVAFGALDLALFLYPLVTRTLWPAPVLMVVIGLPGALLVAGLMTVFQTNTEDGHRGRVFGAAMALEGVAMLGGTLAAGALGGRLGIVPVIAAQGAGYVLAGAVVLATLPRASADVAAEVRTEPPAAALR